MTTTLSPEEVRRLVVRTFRDFWADEEDLETLGEETELGWEGCLSVPGLLGAVPRFTKIRYSGLAPDGSRFACEAEGFHARVVQHECDHLDGILYPQRMTDLSLLLFQEELKHGVPEAMRHKETEAEEAEREAM